MRNIKLLISLLFLTGTLNIFSQVPQSFKYQAMARNAGGDVIVNQSVSLFVEILHGATVVYSESHNAVTNQFGLINLEIGKGNVITGTFSSINWGLGDYFISVSLDPEGGTNYSSVGTAQLLSVPYALYANKSGDSYWTNLQLNLNYNQGKVMIGNSDFLTVNGDLNWIPKLSIEGGLWAKMPEGITTTDIDNMDYNNNTLGTGLPQVGLFSMFDADYHLRGFWGVNIDRNGGYTGPDNPIYKGLNPDAGCFAVRFRTSQTTFRTDFIVNGQGNVGIGVSNPQRRLHISDVLRIEPSAAPANPSEGDIYMDAATHKLMVYDGTSWQACW